MLEYVLGIDKEVFLFINSLMANSLWHAFQVTLSSVWILLMVQVYVLVELWLWSGKASSGIAKVPMGYMLSRFMLLVLSLGLSHGLSDSLLKEKVQRERPCVSAGLMNEMHMDSTDKPSWLLSLWVKLLPATEGFYEASRKQQSSVYNPVGCYSKYGMPSNHAVYFAALAAGVWWFFANRVIALWLVVLAFFVGLSRVSVGVHYPLDVISGWLLGMVVVGMVKVIFDSFVHFRCKYFVKVS